MMDSVQSAIQDAARYLQSSGIPSFRLEAEILLAAVLKLQRIDLYRHSERKLAPVERARYRDVVEKRVQGVPSAYLRGEKEFFSLHFAVGPGVFIPRAETELLVEAAIRLASGIRNPEILDLGTGSGNLLIASLIHLPGARGTGVDISADALSYAEENARGHRVRQRIDFLKGDLLSPAKGKPFDLILSNPPYVKSEEITPELRFEPRIALDGGTDGFRYYRRILVEAWKLLKPGGHLLLEIGKAEPRLLREELDKVSEFYLRESIRKDLAGADRMLVLQSSP